MSRLLVRLEVAVAVAALWGWAAILGAVGHAWHRALSGGGFQLVRDGVAVLAVFGTYRVLLGPREAPPELGAEVRRAARAVHALGLLALVQLTKVVDGTTLAPLAPSVFVGNFEWPLFGHWALLGGALLVAPPVYAGLRARLVLEGGSVRALRRASLIGAAASVATALVVIAAPGTGEPWDMAFLAWALDPLSPFLHTAAPWSTALGELLVASAFVVAARALGAAPEPASPARLRLRRSSGVALHLCAVAAIASLVSVASQHLVSYTVESALLAALVVAVVARVTPRPVALGPDAPRRARLARGLTRALGFVVIALAGFVAWSAVLSYQRSFFPFFGLPLENVLWFPFDVVRQVVRGLLACAVAAPVLALGVLAWRRAAEDVAEDPSPLVSASWLGLLAWLAVGGWAALYRADAAVAERDLFGHAFAREETGSLGPIAWLALAAAVVHAAVIALLSLGDAPREPDDPADAGFGGVDADA